MGSVSLYGNLVVDTIKEDGNRYHQLGGIMNIARRLEHPYFLDYCLGSADINILLQYQTFDSDVAWNNTTWVPDVRETDWHHFSYVNTLPTLESAILPEFGYLSTDFCSLRAHGFGNSERLVQHFDYVFMSSDEADSFFGRFSQQCNIAKKATIVHNANGSIIFSTDGLFRCYTDKIHGPLNTLGAGDALVAHFINHMLGGVYSIQEAMHHAHADTYRHLLS